MRMEFLLVLQQFRETLPDLGVLYFIMSVLASGVPLLFFFVVYYWLFDKRTGLLGLLSFSFVQFVGQTLKTIFCIYRPWVLDPRISPDPSSLSGSFGATGYSCPSMHSASSAAEIGAMVTVFKKNAKAIVILVILLVLFCFSRLFVGVHTPFDVALGVCLGIAGLIVVELCLRIAERKPSAIGVICLVGVLLSVVAMIYTATKGYPMDYVDGVLLVDPSSMIVNTFEGNGTFLGAIAGWFVESRFVKFTPAGSSRQSILLAIGGIVVVALVFACVPLVLKPLFGAVVSGFMKYFLMLFIGIAVWPAIIKSRINQS